MIDAEQRSRYLAAMNSNQCRRIAELEAENAALKAATDALIDSLEPAIHQVGVRITLSEVDRVAICAAIDAARGAK